MENTENNMEFKNDGLPSEITNEQLTQMTDEQIEKMGVRFVTLSEYVQIMGEHTDSSQA